MDLFLRVLVFFASILAAQSQHNLNQLDDRSVIVHMFEWKFSDIALECEQWLGPRGFGAVQVNFTFRYSLLIL